MDAFNYLSVMISVIVGLGLTQLFAGIGNFVQIRRRVRFYWLHALWILLLIVLHLHMWWSFWVLQEVADWHYGIFTYVLVGPAALVVASHIIVPELIDGTIDVEAYYYDTARVFFGMLVLIALWAMFLEPVTGVRQFVRPFRLMQTTGLLVFVACAVSRNKRLHEVAAVLVAALVAIAILYTRFRLGQLALDE